jgi:hypothetical protein
MATRSASSTTSASTRSTTKAPPEPPPEAPAPSPPLGAPEPTRTQLGGTILEDGRPVGYTRDGALSATKGGVKDPTILPVEPASPS